MRFVGPARAPEPAAGIRVLHLTSSFPRHRDDTVAPFLLVLARAQVEAGMDVHVLAPHDAGLPRSEDWSGAGVRRFRYAPPRWERLAYRGGLLGAADRFPGAALVPGLVAGFSAAAVSASRRLAPDVLHAHWWFPGGLAGAVASLATGVPLVVTLHGSDVHLAHRPGWRSLARAVCARASVVAAVSGPLAAEAAKVLGLAQHRVEVAHMPVPPGPAEPSPLPAHPPLRLVAVGRLVPEKGFDVLVDAVSLMVSAGAQVELVVVGDGPEGPALAQRAGALGARVRWAGPLPRAELDAELDAAHALVVPSRREGLGLVALEALARGRPVVAARVGGLPEVVADGADGILVPPGDPAALAEALGRLPLAIPRGAAPVRHRPEEVAAAHLALYRRAIERPM